MLFEHYFASFFVFSLVTTSLVAGLLLTFALIVMPGLRKLGNLEYLNAFREMDGIIQRGQPLFIVIWLGSIVSLTGLSLLGVWQFDGVFPWTLAAVTLAYLVGVHLPTMVVNVPLNNRLQALRLEEMDAPSIKRERDRFEGAWNRWNVLRTTVAVLVTVSLAVMVLLL